MWSAGDQGWWWREVLQSVNSSVSVVLSKYITLLGVGCKYLCLNSHSLFQQPLSGTTASLRLNSHSLSPTLYLGSLCELSAFNLLVRAPSTPPPIYYSNIYTCRCVCPALLHQYGPWRAILVPEQLALGRGARVRGRPLALQHLLFDLEIILDASVRQLSHCNLPHNNAETECAAPQPLRLHASLHHNHSDCMCSKQREASKDKSNKQWEEASREERKQRNSCSKEELDSSRERWHQGSSSQVVAQRGGSQVPTIVAGVRARGASNS